MIITIRENLSVETICPICREPSPRRCESCRSPWHDDCAFACPSCKPDSRVAEIREALEADTFMLPDGTRLSRLEDGVIVEYDDAIIHHALDIYEPGNPKDPLDAVLARSSVISFRSHYPVPFQWLETIEYLGDLYTLEHFLGIDRIPDEDALSSKILGNLRISVNDGIVQVDDGQCVWWGSDYEWQMAIEDVKVYVAKAYLLKDASPISDDWYSTACHRTDLYACTLGDVASDMPPEAAEMICSWLCFSFRGMNGFVKSIRTYLKANRTKRNRVMNDARDLMANFLRRNR